MGDRPDFLLSVASLVEEHFLGNSLGGGGFFCQLLLLADSLVFFFFLLPFSSFAVSIEF
jgi:hypothetical protein